MASEKVAVAVNNKENSKRAVKWALANLVSSSDVLTLIHVRPTVDRIPTPLASMPVSQVNPEMVAAYMREVESKTDRLLKTFKRLCDSCKVSTELVVVESNFPKKALLEEIVKRGITKLILGASSGNCITRWLMGLGLPAYMSKNAPTSCSVHVISKKRLASMKQSAQSLENGSSISTLPSSIRFENRLQSEGSSISLGEVEVTEQGQHKAAEATSQPLPISEVSRPVRICVSQRRAASLTALMEPHVEGGLDRPLLTGNHKSFINHSLSSALSVPQQRNSESQSNCSSSDSLEETQSSSRSGLRSPRGLRYVEYQLDPSHSNDWFNGSYSNTNDQIKKARWLLEQTSLLAERAYETTDVKALQKMRVEQDDLLAAEKAKESTAMELNMATFHVDTLKALQLAQEKIAETDRKLQEALEDTKASKQVAEEEKNSIEDVEAKAVDAQVARQAQECYRVYSYDEILTATNNLSEDQILGEGGYGVVYKGKLDHTNVAIKVMKQNSSQGVEEFEHEVEFLGRIHHPHVVLLLGCCPEKACLIYEFMANGSLEDRLKCQDGTTPLPWFTRFRIAAEVATALHFLHSSKPDPIVHRDIKPGNILLDQNFVSKLGDVGLASLVPAELAAKNSTYFRDTCPVGTFAYMDPEYQHTGFYAPKSDVYALGIVILQLLTGRPPIGLIKFVKDSFDSENFSDILDHSAGDWPSKEASQVAHLALKCANLRRQKRPDLDSKVLPILDKVRVFSDEVAEKKKQLNLKHNVPELFICPILKEMMGDPVIAADGYTYEYAAIEMWLQQHNTSPLTNLPLPHRILMSNFSLCSAIRKWRKEHS